MKKKYLPYFLHILIAIFTIGVAYLVLKPTYKTSGLKIGLINMQRVRDQAEPFLQWQKLVQESSQQAQERFSQLEASLVKDYEVLQEAQQKKRNKPQDLALRKQQLDKKALELEQELQKERDALRQKFDRVGIAIETTLDQIIQEYSKKHQIDLLLNTQIKDLYIALAGDNSLNHTQAIIEALNKKIPNIEKLQH